MSRSPAQASSPPGPSPLAYVARPQGDAAGKVLVLHAWWGLNDFMRGLCDRFAGQGLLAAAPDLYEGEIARTPQEAETLRDKPRREPAGALVVRAVHRLVAEAPAHGRPIGVVGFSMGGYWAFELAKDPELPIGATVVFYEAYARGDYAKSRSAFQAHYAETDPFVPEDERERLARTLAAANKVPDFHVYPGTGHWFFESDRPDAYNEIAARLAWRRTLAFLRSHLAEGAG